MLLKQGAKNYHHKERVCSSAQAVRAIWRIFVFRIKKRLCSFVLLSPIYYKTRCDSWHDLLCTSPSTKFRIPLNMVFSRYIVLGIGLIVTVSASTSCPASNGTTFAASNGAKFEVECGFDRAGGDIKMVFYGSFEDCINGCASTPSCVDVTFLGNACWMKSSVKPVRYTNASGARLITAVGTIILPPVTSTATASLATPTGSASTSQSSVSVSNVSCPTADGQDYLSGNSHYTIECGQDRAGGDFSMGYTHTLGDCISKCAATSGCVDISWVPGRPGPCYLKNSIRPVVSAPHVWGAKSVLVSNMPSSPASTYSSMSSHVLSSSSSRSSSSSGSATASAATASATLNSTHARQHGCGSALPANSVPGGPSQAFNLTTPDGLTRSWILYVPPSYKTTTPAPLIISYHGNGASGKQQEAITGFSTSANTEFVVAYPNGVNGSWEGAPYAVPDVDDVAFTRQLLSSISDSFCIDPARLYASGHSNGGGFTGVLACDGTMSTVFAGFGASSGAFYPGQTGATAANCNSSTVDITCAPGRKNVPVLEVHGDADGTIAYDGGVHFKECLPSLPHYMTLWSQRVGYGSVNASTSLAGGSVQYTFGPLINGTPMIEHFRIAGLPHTWATPSNNAGNFSSTSTMLGFFRRWTLHSV